MKSDSVWRFPNCKYNQSQRQAILRELDSGLPMHYFERPTRMTTSAVIECLVINGLATVLIIDYGGEMTVRDAILSGR